jgi:PKHD-type hydroxylase
MQGMNKIGYFITPKGLTRGFPSHVQWSGSNAMFSPPDCDALIAYGERVGFTRAAVGAPSETRVDDNYRRADAQTIPFGDEFNWLYERVSNRVNYANLEHYDFDLTGLREPFQILKYTAPAKEGDIPGHYDWHQDFGSSYMGSRKISVVINLSDPAEYDGCRLVIKTDREEELAYVGKGEGAMFPSWTPHMVTSITRGTRYALVAWVHGAPFR